MRRRKSTLTAFVHHTALKFLKKLIKGDQNK